MLDPKIFRTQLAETAEQLARRGFTVDVATIESLEAERKTIQTQTQDLQSERNKSSKAIGKAKAAGEDIQPLLDAVANLGGQLKEAEARLSEIQEELNAILMGIPQYSR